MTKTMVEQLVDDLDGTPGERTVTFTWDGIAYEIELSKKNATAFEKTLKPYLDVARRVKTKSTSSRRGGAVRGGKRDLSEIRSWAEHHGFEVSSRGRIASSVIEAYDAAN
jgi:hypothetical protein